MRAPPPQCVHRARGELTDVRGAHRRAPSSSVAAPEGVLAQACRRLQGRLSWARLTGGRDVQVPRALSP